MMRRLEWQSYEVKMRLARSERIQPMMRHQNVSKRSQNISKTWRWKVDRQLTFNNARTEGCFQNATTVLKEGCSSKSLNEVQKNGGYRKQRARTTVD
jgi:hypothetical protein